MHDFSHNNRCFQSLVKSTECERDSMEKCEFSVNNRIRLFSSLLTQGLAVNTGKFLAGVVLIVPKPTALTVRFTML